VLCFLVAVCHWVAIFIGIQVGYMK